MVFKFERLTENNKRTVKQSHDKSSEFIKSAKFIKETFDVGKVFE